MVPMAPVAEAVGDLTPAQAVVEAGVLTQVPDPVGGRIPIPAGTVAVAVTGTVTTIGAPAGTRGVTAAGVPARGVSRPGGGPCSILDGGITGTQIGEYAY